jgi:hypothetical protein
MVARDVFVKECADFLDFLSLAMPVRRPDFAALCTP